MRVLKPVPADLMVEAEVVLPAADPGEDAERQAHEIQAISENVDQSDHVELLGGWYKIADRIGGMSLMKFAVSAHKGGKTEDMQGLVDLFNVLKDCIDAEDWDRFVDDAIENKADFEELMVVFQKAMELNAARPTRPRSGSSSGPSSTGVSSTVGSSSPGPRVLPGFEDLTPVAALG